MEQHTHPSQRSRATTTALPQSGIGTVRLQSWHAWLGLPATPYLLDLERHQGVVLGASEPDLTATLHRLASTAASAGWKVWFFDAYGSPQTAATFVASMQQAGRERVRVFPHDPFDGWQGSHEAVLHRLLQVLPFRQPYAQQMAIAALSAALRSREPLWRMGDLVEQLCWLLEPARSTGRRRGDPHAGVPLLHRLRRGDLPEVPLGYYALSVLLGGSLDGHWSYEHADAAYFALRAWDRPQEARLHARFLLADLASSLVERSADQTPTLLLINHPERLLTAQQLAPLFAQMQQAHGSLWVASRAVESLGEDVLSQASALLLHRSLSSLSLDPFLPLGTHVWAAETLPRLAEHECLALADGVLTPVRVAPVPVDPAAVAQEARTLADRARLLAQGPVPEEEAEGDLASLLAENQEEEHVPELRTASPRAVPTRRSSRRRRLTSSLTPNPASQDDPPSPLGGLWDL